MRFASLLSRSLVACALVACSGTPADPDAGIAPRDARPLPPRDAGPALCPHEGPLDARVPRSSTDLCIEGVVPMGFGLRWQHRAQRLARFGTALDFGSAHVPAGCPAGSTSRGASLFVDVEGGEVALADDRDVPVVFYDYQVVGAREDVVVPDAAVPPPRFARGSATIDLEDGATEGEGLVLVDLAAAGIEAAPALAVVIDGFEVTTDVAQTHAEYPGDWEPARGYALRGIGFAIPGTERMLDTLRVRVRARFEPGRRGRQYWEPGHDRATAVASTRATVRVLVIATDAAPTTGSISYRYAAAQSAPLELGAACRPGDADTALAIDGTPGLAHGAVGITRLDVALWPDQEEAGDLMRELSVRVLDVAYDAATGRATMRVEGYASNEGPLPRAGIDARIDADVALAQWSAGGDVEALSVAAPAEVGRTEIELPMRGM